MPFPENENEKKSFQKQSKQICFWEEAEDRQEISKKGDEKQNFLDLSLPYLQGPVPFLKDLVVDSQNFSPNFLLEPLNPRQREAVAFPDSPLFLIASPGTGKTWTLTYRIAYRILIGEITPDSVLAITFSERSRQEMKDRLWTLLPEEICKQITVCTFYSLGLKILLEESGLVGEDELLFLNERECVDLLKFQEDDLLKSTSFSEVLSLWEDIVLAKKGLSFPEDLKNTKDSLLKQLYSSYQKGLEGFHAFDREDLILWAVGILENVPKIREKYLHQFRSILVDEYQDIHYGQYRLIRLLAPTQKPDLTVAGDPDQSIYGTQGADVRYFLLFDQDYPHSRSIYLNTNYRSTSSIVQASIQVSGRGGDSFEVDENESCPIYLYQADSEEDEGIFLIESIKKLLQDSSTFPFDQSKHQKEKKKKTPVKLSDIAIIYSSEMLVLSIEKILREHEVPFNGSKKGSLESSRIQSFLRVFRVLLFPSYNLELVFLLKDISNKFNSDFWSHLEIWSSRKKCSFFSALKNPDFCKTLPPIQQGEIKSFLSNFFTLQKQVGKIDLCDLAKKIQEYFLEKYNKKFNWREEEIFFEKELKKAGKDLSAFLQHWILKGDGDFFHLDSPKLNLLSIYDAKGLEFPIVFFVGCEENLFMNDQEGKRGEELLEENRRLFYVAMTRAKEKAILTFMAKRKIFRGSSKLTSFLQDVDSNLLFKIPSQKMKNDKDKNQMNLF